MLLPSHQIISHVAAPTTCSLPILMTLEGSGTKQKNLGSSTGCISDPEEAPLSHVEILWNPGIGDHGSPALIIIAAALRSLLACSIGWAQEAEESFIKHELHSKNSLAIANGG
ncbi:hypothetical protein ACJ73_03457 [Blastomyces percursus]|uniref:Uncharacterized protein n=1 Tax=Blastomyces percursus TaxID=1658174 RepID=A0A1J9RB24_9EURO|nr:hypothetical protein ACJ73_03457 [Blastomyces percursus]